MKTTIDLRSQYAKDNPEEFVIEVIECDSSVIITAKSVP